MKTQAVILAAGKGSRLHPLTLDLPKSMLKFNDKEMIKHSLDVYTKLGIKDIIILVGFCADKIINSIGDSYNGAKITYVHNPIYDSTNSTYSLWLAKDLIGSDVIVSNADTVFEEGIIDNLKKSDHNLAMSVDLSKVGKLADDDMKVTIENGIIVDASKQISPDKTHGDAMGVYRFKDKGVDLLFSALDSMVEKKDLNQLFTVAVKSLMKENDVHPVSTLGHLWTEVDTVEDYEKAKLVWGEKK